ncbi:MAG TPA: type I phosphomannose isomerase catalytic subunit [Candidatus Acidoferrales bacterium]|nr:type I phosphomannose isomerase catalytic subunit [Candidatus Acidoferrales bacterium]
MNLRPVRLEPQFVPRIWGARSLAPLFPEKKSLAEPIGEAWLTGDECKFADGPFAGQMLGEVWPKLTEEWIGRGVRRDGPFPMLVKFIFPEDKLSVQVHPDDAYAREHEAAAGGVGKTEMWYVVSARAGAEVRVGMKPEVDREQFRRAIAEGTAEDCVAAVPVRAGDAIFVPAGTVHTIGPGMVLCEIQQNSDITFRVFDYNRVTAEGKTRELHIEKAMDVIRFGEQQGGKAAQSPEKTASSEMNMVVQCPYFNVAKSVFAHREYRTRRKSVFELLIVLEGRGKIEVPGGAVEYEPAQAWFVPASVRDCVFAPEKRSVMLHAWVLAVDK